MRKFKGIALKHTQLGPIDSIETYHSGRQDHEQPRHPLSFSELTPDIIRCRIRTHGIVGMGGGGFSTHIKCSSQQINTVILNGVECDLGIFCDSALMQTRPQALFDAIEVLRCLWPNADYVIALKKSDVYAIASLSPLLEKHANTRLATFPDRYPMGAESLLVKSIANVDLPRGQYPIHHGIVCLNVATVCAIRDAVLDDKPLTDRIITLSGKRLDRPRHIHVAIGTRVRELLSALQINAEQAELFEGGVFMHKRIQLDDCIQKTTTCIRVENPTPHETKSCIRCGDCANVCPEDLLPQSLYWHIQAGEYDKAQKLRLDACMDCNACAYVCPSDIPLVDLFQSAKLRLKQDAARKEKAEKAKAQFEAKESRLARKQALKGARLQNKLNDAQHTDKQKLIQEALARAQAKKEQKSNDSNH